MKWAAVKSIINHLCHIIYILWQAVPVPPHPPHRPLTAKIRPPPVSTLSGNTRLWLNHARMIHSEPYIAFHNLYLEEEEDIDSLVNNITNFNYWCATRVLTLDRKYAKEIHRKPAKTISTSIRRQKRSLPKLYFAFFKSLINFQITGTQTKKVAASFWAAPLLLKQFIPEDEKVIEIGIQALRMQCVVMPLLTLGKNHFPHNRHCRTRRI